MLAVLPEKVDEFNEKVGTGGGGAHLKLINENDNYGLSLVTPYMIRVHENFSQS